MNIVVGFVSTPEGRAALARGIEEARLREAKLIVVHSTRENESAQDTVDYQ